MRIVISLSEAYRLLNHGPVTLVTAAYGGGNFAVTGDTLTVDAA